MPMLQDLDSLTTRIEQMVTLTRQLQAEHTASQARLKALEGERDRLAEQLKHREDDVNTIRGELAEYETKRQAEQDQAQAMQSQLQLELAESRQRCAQTEQLLHSSQQDVSRLRTVSDAARRQIDSILVRLPGAPQE